jgi:hypothetical protein
MRLWTVQPIAVWEQVRAHGRALVDPLRVDPDGRVHPQYEWLVRQLKARTGFRAALPWWAYCERPDLRVIRHLRAHGTREVLIEFETPTAVAFPCWAWHVVFMSDYLPRNRTDHRAWCERLRRAGVGPDDDLPGPFQAEVETSWERLFDPGLSARVPYRDGFTFGANREDVVDVLEAAWVKGVREFVGTNRSLVRAAAASRPVRRPQSAQSPPP